MTFLSVIFKLIWVLQALLYNRLGLLHWGARSLFPVHRAIHHLVLSRVDQTGVGSGATSFLHLHAASSKGI